MTSGTGFVPGPIRGRFRVDPDKSISHRALILGAASPGGLRIRNLNRGDDVSTTQSALQLLGARVEKHGDETVVAGATLHSPQRSIDCANSGSTARMLMGACAGAAVTATFDGDASLRRRPMEPLAAQLRAFGAQVETSNGTLPASVTRTGAAQTRRFILLTASAQIKSALLFAGVFAGVPVSTTGAAGSRDHTERLLQFLGADITFDRGRVELRSPPRRSSTLEIPGDFSTAACYLVAATIARGSDAVIESVGVNPTRTGLLDALQAMGAHVRLENQREYCGEPVADLRVTSAALHGIQLGPDIVRRCIDEMLLIALAAGCAHGETRITGIGDLRDKESDRFQAIERLLGVAGVHTERVRHGIVIGGGGLTMPEQAIESFADHRVAMAAAVLGAVVGPVQVDDARCIEVSAPAFLESWPLKTLDGS